MSWFLPEVLRVYDDQRQNWEIENSTPLRTR